LFHEHDFPIVVAESDHLPVIINVMEVGREQNVPESIV